MDMALAKERRIPSLLIVVGLSLYAYNLWLHHSPYDFPSWWVLVEIPVQIAIYLSVAFLGAMLVNEKLGETVPAVLKFLAALLLSGGVAAVSSVGWIVGAPIFLLLIFWLFELDPCLCRRPRGDVRSGLSGGARNALLGNASLLQIGGREISHRWGTDEHRWNAMERMECKQPPPAGGGCV